MPIAINDKGDALRLDGNRWVPTKTARNPQTGEVIALDGDKWVLVKRREVAPGPAPSAGQNRLTEFRSRYPQYSDMSDGDLADALHRKFYSDIPRDKFNESIGFAPPPAAAPVAGARQGRRVARVQLEDGRIARFEVPEGTTPEQVLEFADTKPWEREVAPGPANSPPPNGPPVPPFPGSLPPDIQDAINRAKSGLKPARTGGQHFDTIEGDQRGRLSDVIANTATFGLTDEVGGAGAAMGAFLRRIGGDIFGGSVPDIGAASNAAGQAYDRRLGEIRDDLSAYRKRNPKTAIMGDIAGGAMLGGTAFAPQAGPAVTGRLANILRNTKVGAGYGAAAGFGNAEGGATDRSLAAGGGAVLGGVTGAVAPAVISGIGKVGKAAVRPFLPNKAPAAESRAVRKVLEAIERDQLTPRQAAANAKALGKAATLADTGPNISGLAEAAANRPGKSLTAATDAFSDRRGGQVSRILSHFDDAIGPPGQQVAQSIETTPAFSETLRKSVPVDDDLARLMARPSMRQAWDRARSMAGETDQALPAFDDFARRVKAGEIREVRTDLLHWLKKGLDDVLEPQRSAITGTLQANRGVNEMRAMQDTRRAFRDIVKARNPDYGKALDTIAAEKRVGSAYDKGADFFKIRHPDDIMRQLARMDDRERRSYLTGIRDAMENKISDPGALGRDMSSPALMHASKLRAAFGDKADDLIAALRNERTMAGTENRVLGNSRTAFRQAAGEDAGLAAYAPSVLSGDVHGLAGQLLRGLARTGGGARQQATFDAMAPILFGPPGGPTESVLAKALAEAAGMRARGGGYAAALGAGTGQSLAGLSHR